MALAGVGLGGVRWFINLHELLAYANTANLGPCVDHIVSTHLNGRVDAVRYYAPRASHQDYPRLMLACHAFDDEYHDSENSCIRGVTFFTHLPATVVWLFYAVRAPFRVPEAFFYRLQLQPGSTFVSWCSADFPTENLAFPVASFLSFGATEFTYFQMSSSTSDDGATVWSLHQTDVTTFSECRPRFDIWKVEGSDSHHSRFHIRIDHLAPRDPPPLSLLALCQTPPCDVASSRIGHQLPVRHVRLRRDPVVLGTVLVYFSDLPGNLPALPDDEPDDDSDADSVDEEDNLAMAHVEALAEAVDAEDAAGAL